MEIQISPICTNIAFTVKDYSTKFSKAVDRVSFFALNVLSCSIGMACALQMPSTTVLLTFGAVFYCRYSFKKNIAILNFQNPQEIIKMAKTATLVFSFALGTFFGGFVHSIQAIVLCYQTALATRNAYLAFVGTSKLFFLEVEFSSLKVIHDVWITVLKSLCLTLTSYKEGGVKSIFNDSRLRKLAIIIYEMQEKIYQIFANTSQLLLFSQNYPEKFQDYKNLVRKIPLLYLENADLKEINEYFKKTDSSYLLSIKQLYKDMSAEGKKKIDDYFESCLNDIFNQIPKIPSDNEDNLLNTSELDEKSLQDSDKEYLKILVRISDKLEEFCKTLDKEVKKADNLVKIDQVLENLNFYNKLVLELKKMFRNMPEIEKFNNIKIKIESNYNTYLQNNTDVTPNIYRENLLKKRKIQQGEDFIDDEEPSYIVLPELFQESQCRQHVEILKLEDEPNKSFIEIFIKELERKDLHTVGGLKKAGLYPMGGTVEERKTKLYQAIKTKDSTKPSLSEVKTNKNQTESFFQRSLPRIIFASKKAFFEIAMWTARLITIYKFPREFCIGLFFGIISDSASHIQSLLPAQVSFASSERLRLMQLGVTLYVNSSPFFLGLLLGSESKKLASRFISVLYDTEAIFDRM